ncbi:unnamed protein product [Closterium sp. Yama58-4]|nr:unnamed protein product [Closterium sp. Yama58-4]
MGPCTAAMTSISPASAALTASMTSNASSATTRSCMFVRSRSETVHRRALLSPLPSFSAKLPVTAYVPRIVIASAGVSRSRATRLNAGRSVHYETANTYVFIAPGEEEVFLSREKVLQCLLNELQSWEKDGKRLSDDLAVFETLAEAAEFLLDSACELELGGGKGALQWFESTSSRLTLAFILVRCAFYVDDVIFTPGLPLGMPRSRYNYSSIEADLFIYEITSSRGSIVMALRDNRRGGDRDAIASLLSRLSCDAREFSFGATGDSDSDDDAGDIVASTREIRATAVPRIAISPAAARSYAKTEARANVYRASTTPSCGSSDPPVVLSPLEFYRDYVAANRPCVITGAVNHWPALSLWQTDQYLVDALGEKKITVDFTPDGHGDAIVWRDGVGRSEAGSAERGDENLGSGRNRRQDEGASTGYGCRSGDDSEARGVGVVVLVAARAVVVVTAAVVTAFLGLAAVTRPHQNGSFRTEFAALAADADEHIGFATAALGGNLPEAVNLWIGDERAVTSWHKDHYENFYVVVTGRKTFRLLPPLDVFRMRVREYPAAKYWRAEDEQGAFRIVPSDPPCMVPWASVDAALNPFIPCPHALIAASAGRGLGDDPKGPPPLVCTIGPGEMLYLPSMWYHHVSQSRGETGRTIALNYWYDMQFDVKYAYFNLVQSLTRAYRL